MKKRLTLLLTGDQIHQIKVKAAIAGKPASQWIIDSLDLDQGPEPENITEILPESEEPALVPEILPELTDRDQELIRVYESVPEGREYAQARADALNAAGVPVKGGVWTKKNAGDAYRRAIKKKEKTNG
jgi:hypothetical protein